MFSGAQWSWPVLVLMQLGCNVARRACSRRPWWIDDRRRCGGRSDGTRWLPWWQFSCGTRRLHRWKSRCGSIGIGTRWSGWRDERRLFVARDPLLGFRGGRSAGGLGAVPQRIQRSGPRRRNTPARRPICFACQGSRRRHRGHARRPEEDDSLRLATRLRPHLVGPRLCLYIARPPRIARRSLQRPLPAPAVSHDDLLE